MTSDTTRKNASELAPPEAALKIRRLQKALDDKCAELARANSIINTLREKIGRVKKRK